MDSQEFAIVTDSNNDMPDSWLEENRITVLPYFYTITGSTYHANDPAMPLPKFYGLMRQGEPVSTSHVNMDQAVKAIDPILAAGKDVLCLSFSSGLSGGYNALKLAQEQLSQTHPQRKLIVIDTLAASMGQGLLVYQAVRLRGENKTIEETAGWVEENKLNVAHIFTVDDLMYLHRGGRVSKTSAVIGSMLGIKPILHVDNEGRLIPINKVRGRRQSLENMVDKMADRIGQWKNEVILISNADCPEDARFLGDLVQKRFGIEKIIIHDIDSTIGAHSGPGTVALFFMGDHR